MSYVLLNKFQGAFLGSLAQQNLKTSPQSLKTNWDFNILSHKTKPQWFLFLKQDVVSVMPKQEKLVNMWFDLVFEAIPTANKAKTASCSALALLLLPIILYYCDYWHYLAQYIKQKCQELNQSSAEIDTILVWCYGVRLALRGELVGLGLTERVVQETQIQQQSVISWLKTIEASYLEGWSFSKLLQELSNYSGQIPLSWFCFFNNAEDFDLTTQQASFLESNFPLVTALSGVLSGAYNGLTGIPVNWRNQYQNQDFYRQTIIQTEEMTKEWLGIEGANNVNQERASCIITAPRILQSRSSLRIISQQEYQSKRI